MLKWIIVVLALSVGVAVAQAPPAPKAPAGGGVCDVVYTIDVNMIDAQGVERDVVGPIPTPIYGLPMAQVLDNSAKGLEVVKLAAKLQNQGGPYTIELGEVRSCDGKPPERVAANSILVKGVTLDGQNKIARESLKQSAFIIDRYEAMVKKGDKAGWDHAKGRKTKRNDLGQKVKD